jgi:Holliday junction resolvase RusA-like endonuclease
MTFQESDRLEVEVRLVMTTSQFNFHDVDNRLKDVLDALQARVGGPKSVRLLAPLIPNDKQVTRALIEKVEGAEPNGVLTIRVVR